MGRERKRESEVRMHCWVRLAHSSSFSKRTASAITTLLVLWTIAIHLVFSHFLFSQKVFSIEFFPSLHWIRIKIALQIIIFVTFECEIIDSEKRIEKTKRKRINDEARLPNDSMCPVILYPLCVCASVAIAMLGIQFDFNAMQIVQMKSCSACECELENQQSWF